MVGTGMTPEGINTNPIVYNLYAEMFWRGAVAPDLDTWVVRYYQRRYGLSLKGGGGGGGGAAGCVQGGGCGGLLTDLGLDLGERHTAADELVRQPAVGGRRPDVLGPEQVEEVRHIKREVFRTVEHPLVSLQRGDPA